ncbi:MAG: RNA polymerase sigma factor [Gemmatimonas sp.]|uniref:RNA polymerase sigma factor n=1 Tax=Gemmatimonas sp. TaxID=1962908 RepID=UPI00391EE783|nr:RNA polymerase sigma factor [Gemmatimonadota bacterium]
MTSDAALLSAAAAGDAAAFATFMRAHQGAVHRHLVAFTGHHDVDDALQETFIAAWRAAAGFHGGGSARGWLFTIARNVVRHQVRRRVDEPAQLESLDELAERAGWGSIPDERVRPEAGLARELLAVAFDRLPPEEREVLTLRELDGLSGDETASLLHLTVPAMKSRLHRARLHLAAVLRALEAPAPRDGVTTHD